MNSIFINACNNNDINVIKYFIDNNLFFKCINSETFYKLCQHGNIDIIKYCILHVTIKYNVALTYAYKSGNIDLVSLLLSYNKHEVIDFIPHFIYLLKNNQVNIIEVILNNNDIFVNKKLIVLFCKYNNFDAIKLLLSKIKNVISFSDQFAKLCDSNTDHKILNILLSNDYLIINIVSTMFMKENFNNFKFLISKLNLGFEFSQKFKSLCHKNSFKFLDEHISLDKSVIDEIKCIVDCPLLNINLNSVFENYFDNRVKLVLINNYFDLIKDKLDYSSHFCLSCPNLNVQKHVIKVKNVDPSFIKYLVITQSPIYLFLCSKKIKLCSDVLSILNNMIY